MSPYRWVDWISSSKDTTIYHKQNCWGNIRVGPSLMNCFRSDKSTCFFFVFESVLLGVRVICQVVKGELTSSEKSKQGKNACHQY